MPYTQMKNKERMARLTALINDMKELKADDKLIKTYESQLDELTILVNEEKRTHESIRNQ